MAESGKRRFWPARRSGVENDLPVGENAHVRLVRNLSTGKFMLNFLFLSETTHASRSCECRRGLNCGELFCGFATWRALILRQA